MAIIELEHLTKRFGDLIAVDDVTLDIADGEFFGLLGPNGAGKATTLLMLTTLLRPTSGTARVSGFDLARESRRVRGAVGIVFQDPSSDDTLTGYENLKLHGMLYHMPVALREQRISELLALVDLTDRKDHIVKHYSGGMRRRLELVPILAVTTASLVSVGLIIGAMMESPEGFQLVSSFLIFPTFFLSGALFPLDQLPPWLAPLVLIDPLSYSVDALRHAILGKAHFPLSLDLVLVTAFLAVTVVIGSFAFRRMKV